MAPAAPLRRRGSRLWACDIEHFRSQLETETDEPKRQIRLLAEEEAKLASLDPPNEPK
jgi:hypothetical protein